MSKLEIENKYLVKPPESWSNLAQLLDGVVDIKRISQAYLKPKGTEPSARIRKTVEGLVGDINTVYHYNQKKPVEKGVHKESEHEISKPEYDSLLKEIRPDKFILEKIRFVFNYKDQTFELDIFKGPLKGLAILEIELENKDDEVILPPFLDIIKEVTTDDKYNNFNLSSKNMVFK